jgi:hypothetical protein
VNLRNKQQPPATGQGVTFASKEAAETVIAAQQRGYLHHMTTAAQHRDAAAAKAARLGVLVQEIAEKQAEAKRLEADRAEDEQRERQETEKGHGFEVMLQALGAPTPPLPSPVGAKAAGNPYPETGMIAAVDVSQCQTCGQPMLWDEKHGFVHPIEGGYEAAGELCRYRRPGDTQALPSGAGVPS